MTKFPLAEKEISEQEKTQIDILKQALYVAKTAIRTSRDNIKMGRRISCGNLNLALEIIDTLVKE